MENSISLSCPGQKVLFKHWLEEEVGVGTRTRQGRQGNKTANCVSSGSALVDFIKHSQMLGNREH